MYDSPGIGEGGDRNPRETSQFKRVPEIVICGIDNETKSGQTKEYLNTEKCIHFLRVVQIGGQTRCVAVNSKKSRVEELLKDHIYQKKRKKSEALHIDQKPCCSNLAWLVNLYPGSTSSKWTKWTATVTNCH